MHVEQHSKTTDYCFNHIFYTWCKNPFKYGSVFKRLFKKNWSEFIWYIYSGCGAHYASYRSHLIRICASCWSEKNFVSVHIYSNHHVYTINWNEQRLKSRGTSNVQLPSIQWYGGFIISTPHSTPPERRVWTHQNRRGTSTSITVKCKGKMFDLWFSDFLIKIHYHIY